MTSATSVKDRLKKQAVKDGKTMQDKLVTFGLERTVYRISVSSYAKRFTLKGGIFLYTLFDGKYARATVDIDLLAHHIPNNVDEIKKIFKDIFSIQCDDAIRFDLDTLEVINITEFKEYHGVKVSVMGYLDRTKVPVSIDIGFGDVIYPERMKMEFPVLLDMEAPEVYAYSIYSVIAEKFEAFVSLGLANSRYKDFYDIYVLADRYDLDGSELKNAIVETFCHRGTGFDDIVAFETDFTEDVTRQSRWKAFTKKKSALVQVDFKETMALIKTLLMPVAEAIQSNSPFDMKWSKDSKSWD
ncbi:nucleotidyl transferase AbiEii/AbiGii toxin family protein [Anaerovorax odorimutans]|uniref:Nucleotidyl transferase AbiEii/AbiGii toxin family protein n=1 Tax=Anaerovorax odorimutans TaxID=109327 RepID=A0ABT1RQD6_9FIRM|nr:nucleotidyl transferase AbiEii/AbiGii toxin family protein [Anaerovorax odorimutans]MCQ4637381.1 nucleotidyl transferase AbiEii/AbiGii toxin family protein [Anaerovorax odorimutans]